MNDDTVGLPLQYYTLDEHSLDCRQSVDIIFKQAPPESVFLAFFCRKLFALIELGFGCVFFHRNAPFGA